MPKFYAVSDSAGGLGTIPFELGDFVRNNNTGEIYFCIGAGRGAGANLININGLLANVGLQIDGAQALPPGVYQLAKDGAGQLTLVDGTSTENRVVLQDLVNSNLDFDALQAIIDKIGFYQDGVYMVKIDAGTFS